MAKKQKHEEQQVEEMDVTEPEAEETVEEDIELSLEQQLTIEVDALKQEVTKWKNEYLKEKADLENVKKRLEKERVIERKYAALSTAKAFLGPVDHFELALRHEPKDDETKTFVQGFKMILTEIKKGLEDVGVSEIDALGEEYDPNFHQAVMTEKQEGTNPNIVIEVLQKGYMFKDRVIRPAMVKISE
jgi:molecular chaperone GrpE